jgi:RNA polymerase sigma factor (sigma-70 family)
MESKMDHNISGEIGLLQSSIQGSNEAFERLVRKYQSLVCAITYSATGDIEKSEELAQETFVRAWKNLTQLRDQSRFKFWLCSIAKSTIKNYFRDRNRDIIHKASEITDAQAISSDAPDPSHGLIAKEQQAVVDQALQSLPESYRQPIVLFYRQEQSVAQVADLLDISEDNVRTRLSRGRKMLKVQVSEMIENTLKSTAPGKVFTVAVMASVAGIAIKGTAAAATQMSSSASWR